MASGILIVPSNCLELLEKLYPTDHEAVCYLLCFEDDLGNPSRYPFGRRPGHYLGTTTNLIQRLNTHFHGDGARLVEVIQDHGLSFSLVRLWDGGHDRERALKSRKNHSRLCPRCRREHNKKRRLRRETRKAF